MKDWKQIAEQAQADRDLLAQELVHLKNQIGTSGNIDTMVTLNQNNDAIYAIKIKSYIHPRVEDIIANYEYNKINN